MFITMMETITIMETITTNKPDVADEEMDEQTKKPVPLITFTHNNIVYINADFVLRYARKFIKGDYIKSTRQIIKVKNISPNDYTFARFVNNEWVVHVDKAPRLDKAFFKKRYVDKISEIASNAEYMARFPKTDDDMADTDDTTNPIVNMTIPEPVPKPISNNKNVVAKAITKNKSKTVNVSDTTSTTSTSIVPLQTTNDKSVKNADDVITIAPPLFILNPDQKFRSDDGIVIEVETRGVCSVEDILFSVKDISVAFGFEDLKKTIVFKASSYNENEHYKTFYIKKRISKSIKNEGYVCKMYLTYVGLLKTIFSCQGTKTKKFIKWATETLFACHMGNEEQRRKLVAGLMGVSSQVVKEMFKINGAETPCIYIMFIGNAKKLLGGDYDEDQILCKYGYSCDLPRRVSEHQVAFGNEFSVRVELLYFSIIDAKHISTAETRLKEYLRSKLIEYKSMVELFVINKKELPAIKEYCKTLQETYIGQFKMLDDENVRLKNQLIEMKNEYEFNVLKYQTDSERLLLEKEAHYSVILREKDRMMLQQEIDFNKLISEKDKELVQKDIKYQEMMKAQHAELTQKITELTELLNNKTNELMKKISEFTESLSKKNCELEQKNCEILLLRKDIEILQKDHEIALYKLKAEMNAVKIS